MEQTFRFHSDKEFDLDKFMAFAGLKDYIKQDYIFQAPEESDETPPIVWRFFREGYSTTSTIIKFVEPNEYEIIFDQLSSMADYKLLPYILDSFSKYMGAPIENIPEGENLYKYLGESWTEEMIGEEVAVIKGTLILSDLYIINNGEFDTWITTDILKEYGVTLTSSTPRIYNYIQFMLRENLLPEGFISENEINAELNEKLEATYDNMPEDEEILVDIPQHISIGKAKSWQLDGEETFDSYSQEDVDALLKRGADYENGVEVVAEVLNDLGTIYQEGIGVEKDGEKAVKWFQAAYMEGDALFAPTNLGDIYRKGTNNVEKSLQKAVEWYLNSEDPYALYRIGQSFEEGWISEPNLDEAMKWYNKSKELGHHLAIKRLAQVETNAE